MNRSPGALCLFVAILAGMNTGFALANTPPTAHADRVVVRGVRYVLVDVLANDSDPDGDPLRVTITGGGDGVTQLGDGLLQFQPTACLDTAQVVSYQVEDGAGGTASSTLTLAAGGCDGNLVPLAIPDIGDTSPETMALLYVLANDSDPDGDPLCIDRVFDLHHGTATISADCQRVDFMPSPGYQGADASFRYAVQDGRGGEAEAIARISVFGGMPGDPINPDQFFTEESKILVLRATDLLANDDPGVTFEDAYSLAGDGVDVIWAPSGEIFILYHPPQGWVGSRDFHYQATDSAAANGNTQTFEDTVTVHIGTPVGSMRAQDDAQRTVEDGCMTVDLNHLAANDLASGTVSIPTIVSLPKAGTLEPIAGSGGNRLLYRPSAGYQGKDFFTYAVTDTIDDGGGGSTDVATVVLDVRDPGAPGALNPVTLLDNAEVDVSANWVDFNVLVNDYHPQCDSLELIGVLYSGGSANVTYHSNGDIRYRPLAGATPGEDVFTYVVRKTGSSGPNIEGTVRVERTGSIPEPWPRFSYRDCDDFATCIVDGLNSRTGYNSGSSPWVWGNCNVYWQFEEVNGPPSLPLPCHPNWILQRVQSLSDRYTSSGLRRVDLSLWNHGGGETASATAGRWVPVGGTTTEWTIGHHCTGSTCTFWPEGNWVDGVIERFEWHFDGNQGPPDLTTFDSEPVENVYAGAAPGQSFTVTLYFYVFDLQGRVGSIKNVTMPVPLPSPPSGLAADNNSCKSTGPRLTWVDNAQTEEGYYLYRGVNGGPLALHAELEAGETELEDFYSGPRDDVLTYQAAAFNDGGIAFGGVLDARPTPADCDGGEQAPVAPTQLTADPPVGGVRLYWRDNSALEAGHRIYRKSPGGSFQLLATVAGGAETYFDGSLASGSTETYQVTAFNAFGESAPTAAVVVVVPDFVFADSFESGDFSAWSMSLGSLTAPPAASRSEASRGQSPDAAPSRSAGVLENLPLRATNNLQRPSDLQVRALRRSGVELTWNDNAESEQGFEVLRKDKGSPWVSIATLPENSRGLFDGPLEAGKKYRYRVVAFDDRGKRKKSPILRVEFPRALFRDSFETAKLGSWTFTVDSQGRLDIGPSAALFGNFGLAVSLGGAPAYLVDTTPAEERRYRARFLLDPREISSSIGEGQNVATVLEARSPPGTEIFSLRLLRTGAALALEARLTTANGTVLTSPLTQPLDTRVQHIEVDWQAEHPSGNGRLRLWLNGKKVALLEGWDGRDLAISEVRFGSAEASSASGQLGLDEFLSRRGGGRLRQQELAGDLFQEGFEFEALLGWQLEAQGGGSVAVAPARLEGESALEVTLSGQGQKAYLERRLRYPERHLLASLLVDAGNLTVPAGSKVQILSALGRESDDEVLGLYLKQTGDGLEVRAQARDGGGNRAKQLLLPAGPARIEVEWRSSTSATAGDGSLVLRVTDEVADDSTRRALESLATGGEEAGTLKVGTAKNTPAGVSGTYLLDDLEIWR